MLGTNIHQLSMDAGERWMVNDVAGKPLRAWDSRGHTFRTEYDALHRPIRSFVQGVDVQDPARDILFGRTEYGEGQPNDRALNLRTRVFRQYDGAGVVSHFGRNPITGQDEAYDFKGNLLRSTRQLAEDYHIVPDWSADPAVSVDVFTSSSTFDALNRPITVTSPDGSVIRPEYNEANLLERLAVSVRGDATPTPFVANIDYDAKGQRELIDYGNGVRTDYEYDPETFRLIHLSTSSGLQDLWYTYDPIGNITAIRDDAQQAIYFDNQIVQPRVNYVYDALYRLVEATGREHIGQGGAPQTTWDDRFRVHLPHPRTLRRCATTPSDTTTTRSATS